VKLEVRDRATVAVSLRGASERIDTSEARLLLGYALGVARSGLIAHPERVLDEHARARFAELVARRAAGEPIAYIVCEREFWGLPLRVTPAVLIPRPETELLVERVLEQIPDDAAEVSVLDLGTGSGAVAIAIARERPKARVVATDLSEDALAVARENAARHGAAISFARGDWFAPAGADRFDVIVSNPPYVASGDPHLSRGDVRFEPRGALDGGPDGLDCIRRIVCEGRAHLRPGGWLAIEHGYDQAPACRELLVRAGYDDVRGHDDLAGQPRACVARTAR
jgi:release factor glutamine methyltransferase